MVERFNKSAAPSGVIIDRSALRSITTGRLNPTEVCEIREHSLAAGHAPQLLRSLIRYNVGADLALSQVLRGIEGPAFTPLREELLAEVRAKKALLVKHNTVLLQVLQQLETAKRQQAVLPSFRDAVVDESL
jgi:hypothetical protein